MARKLSFFSVGVEGELRETRLRLSVWSGASVALQKEEKNLGIPPKKD